MSNAKEIYSEASKYYCETKVPSNPIDLARYNRAKLREKEGGFLSLTQSVSLFNLHTNIL